MNINKQIPIKKALKMWIGEKYNEHDYEIYLRMKEIGCQDIFYEASRKGGNGLYIGEGYVDLEKNTVNKSFFDKFGRGRYRNGTKATRKIKDFVIDKYDNKKTIEFDTADQFIAYLGESHSDESSYDEKSEDVEYLPTNFNSDDIYFNPFTNVINGSLCTMIILPDWDNTYIVDN